MRSRADEDILMSFDASNIGHGWYWHDKRCPSLTMDSRWNRMTNKRSRQIKIARQSLESFSGLTDTTRFVRIDSLRNGTIVSDLDSSDLLVKDAKILCVTSFVKARLPDVLFNFFCFGVVSCILLMWTSRRRRHLRSLRLGDRWQVLTEIQCPSKVLCVCIFVIQGLVRLHFRPPIASALNSQSSFTSSFF